MVHPKKVGNLLPFNNKIKTQVLNLGSDIFQVKFLNDHSLVSNSNNECKCTLPPMKDTSVSKFKLNFELGIEAIDSNREIFELLISKFGGCISYDKLNNKYIYSSGSFSSARNIIKYFDTFHLQSSKYRDYLKWRKTYCIVQAGTKKKTC